MLIPVFPVSVNTILLNMLQALKNISGEFPSMALLEESMARDASREKIYFDKLDRWIYAKPKEEK
jgi:Amt family ammonium transporter